MKLPEWIERHTQSTSDVDHREVNDLIAVIERLVGLVRHDLFCGWRCSQVLKAGGLEYWKSVAGKDLACDCDAGDMIAKALERKP